MKKALIVVSRTIIIRMSIGYSFQNALNLIPEPREEFSATTWLYAGLGDV